MNEISKIFIKSTNLIQEQSSKLIWYFFDWITGDYGGDGEMSFVLE
jgi:hypothetical protein